MFMTFKRNGRKIMKSIILLLTDTFRYDNLGERATSVERFYMNSFPTIPHRTDFATGVLGWPHYGWQPIDLSGPNHIGRMLRQQDYATQLICDCPHLFNNRFQQGFDTAFQLRGQESDLPLLHLNGQSRSLTVTPSPTSIDGLTGIMS